MSNKTTTDPTPAEFAAILVEKLVSLSDAHPSLRRVEEQTISWRGKAYFIGSLIRVDMLPTRTPVRVHNLPMDKTGCGERSEPVAAGVTGPDIPGEGYNPPGPKHF